jgi:hypothetical protein
MNSKNEKKEPMNSKNEGESSEKINEQKIKYSLKDMGLINC